MKRWCVIRKWLTLFQMKRLINRLTNWDGLPKILPQWVVCTWIDGTQYQEILSGTGSGTFGTSLQSAALVIDTIRTFFLIVLAILGPIAFAISVYDGFQATLTQWITRYISVYLWLPVSDLFSSILARIQVLMLQKDIQELSDPNFVPDGSNSVYIIFMIIGIIGYFTIPTVSNWIIQAGGMGNMSRNINSTASKTGSGVGAVAGAATGNAGGRVGGKLIKGN